MTALSTELLGPLAEHQQPDRNGAMERNRQAYVHVRFQMGLHQLVDFALVNQDKHALQAFFRAVDCAMQHQQSDGDFQVQLPPELDCVQTLSVADRTSGVAFFR